jgi:MFS family permease
MVVFAVGETLFSPTLPAIINDLAPPEAVGRYNGLGVLAFTTGFLLGPVGGTTALPVAGGAILFPLLIVACLGAAVAALRLGRRLAPEINTIEVPTATDAAPAEAADPAGPSATLETMSSPGTTDATDSSSTPDIMCSSSTPDATAAGR